MVFVLNSVLFLDVIDGNNKELLIRNNVGVSVTPHIKTGGGFNMVATILKPPSRSPRCDNYHRSAEGM